MQIVALTLRWLAFLPIGLIAIYFLQVLPVVAFEFARTTELANVTLLGLIIAGFVVTTGLGLLIAWNWTLFFIPFVVCRWIAPNRKIASVILGTAVLGPKLLYLVWINWQSGLVFLAYQLWCTFWIGCGIVVAYNDEDLA